MNQLNLGNTKVFPGNSVMVAKFDDSESFPVRWGLDVSLSRGMKLYCTKSTFTFYGRWKPCVIRTMDGFYGGITNDVSLLVYAQDFNPVKFNSYEEFLQLYSESVEKR